MKVLDANGNTVAGATVTFTLGSGTAGSSACGASATAGASFVGGGAQATATTDASGVATSPPLMANAAAGRFTATATVSDAGGAASPAGGSGSGAGGSSAAIETSFALANLAGAPARIAAGVGATESTEAGARFPIGLAVTVTDAEKNPVPGALVTFAAPASGPSGRFTIRSAGRGQDRPRVSHPRAVKVETDACGIAVAPPLTATREQGGYIVKATAGRARPAAFALVNEAPGRCCERGGEPGPEAAAAWRSGARGERGAAHEADAGGSVGAGDRDRGRCDRGCAGPFLLEPGGAAEADRPAGHEPADGDERPELHRQDGRAAAGGAGDDRPHRPCHERGGDGEGHRGRLSHAR